MAQLRIHATRQDGQLPNVRGDLNNEFAPLSMGWREPGMAYCWLDADKRSLPSRLRLGWKVCNAKEDFLDRGCPPDKLPGYTAPTGEVQFGGLILGKMPAERLSAIRVATEDKIRNRYRGYVNAALDAGEQIARSVGSAAKGRNLVYTVAPDEERQDYHNDYKVRTRTGGTIR